MAIWRWPVEKINHVLQYKALHHSRGIRMVDMNSTAFKLTTPDEHTIHGTVWHSAGDVRGIIQIFHGLGEHHERYERFANLCTAQGYSVVAHDHRGHGKHTDELGYFAESGGWQLLCDDGLLVNDMIKERFDGRPVVLLGHSMGSYIAQYFSMFHDHRLSALILSASTWPARAKLIPGLCIAYAESWRMGLHGKSALLDKLGFGDFNKPFRPARTDLDWLSRDEAEVDAYVADPLCGGPYSCGLWLDLMKGLLRISADNDISRIRSDLPILLTGGSDDPVGGEKGITKLALHYAQTLHGRLSVKIYEGGRHEMFNESNRDAFSHDTLEWIDKQLPAVTGT